MLLFQLLIPVLAALTIDEKYEKLSRVPFITPQQIYVKVVEPQSDIHTQYDQYIKDYRDLGFDEFNSDPEYTWTFFLEGNQDDSVKYQTYYMHFSTAGELRAEISRLYGNYDEVQPPGFDFYIYHIYTGHIYKAVQVLYAKVIKVQLDQGDYLLIFKNRDTNVKRIRFESSILLTPKGDSSQQQSTDPLDRILSDLQGINSDIRNFMTHHSEDLAESNVHAKMQSLHSLKQYGYAVLEVLCIFVLNVAQILYIRRLLSRKVLI